MSAKTKIVVVRMKNLIFTGVLIGIAILMLFMIINVLVSGRKSATPAMAPSLYVPGVYSSSVLLNGSSLDVQVTVDDNYITSVELVNLDETIQTIYPLIPSAMNELSDQILENQSVDNITYSQGNQYTSMVLMTAVEDALKKAYVQID